MLAIVAQAAPSTVVQAAHTGSILAVSASTLGGRALIASGGHAGRIAIHDGDLRLIHRVPAFGGAIFSLTTHALPDGVLLAAGTHYIDQRGDLETVPDRLRRKFWVSRKISNKKGADDVNEEADNKLREILRQAGLSSKNFVPPENPRRQPRPETGTKTTDNSSANTAHGSNAGNQASTSRDQRHRTPPAQSAPTGWWGAVSLIA